MSTASLRALAAALTFGCIAFPTNAQQSINVQVINDSGVADDKVFLLLSGAGVTLPSGTSYPLTVSGIASFDSGATSPPSTSGTSLNCPAAPKTPCTPFAQATQNGSPLAVNSPYSGRQNLPVYQFTMTSVSSGALFVSYDTPVTLPSAPTVTAQYRFQPLEFSYSQYIVSNGDLTSIDFFGIPLEVSTYAPGDTAFVNAQDRVTYYTSTPSLLKAFTKVNPLLQHAFVAKGPGGNTTFVPGTTEWKDFLRVIGPNQAAAPGTSPVPGGLPVGSSKPWPYPSFAGYLDSLVNINYTFTESDNNQVSAYTFNYTGTIQKMTAGAAATATAAAIPATTESCLDPTLAVDGWLIKLTGTTAASTLPGNMDICIPLPSADNGKGNADFFIYGAVQNCDSLGVASSGVLQACKNSDATALGDLTNSVYGWIQADVLSALNFGYMNGKADGANNGTGASGIWYNLPPVQYPFGQARTNNDGNYNLWAALMYNHSDAYGFAFSDRNGRPSPDIAFPIGGTLRIWILPDQRLDTPLVAVTATDDSSITLAWPAVDNASSYTVTWSPPYTTASTQLPPPNPSQTVIYPVTGLTAGTPYTITVRAYGTDPTTSAPIQSFELPVYARTKGQTPAPAAGNAQIQFGFNWSPPAYMSANSPVLYIGGTPFTFNSSNSSWDTSTLINATVGLPPASAVLTVGPATACTAPCVTQTISPASIAPGGSATLTIVISNPATAGELTLPNGFSVAMPAGVTASASGSQCTGVVVNPTNISVGAVQVSATTPTCTITASLTSTTSGIVVVTTPAVATDQGTAPATSAALTVTGSGSTIAQTITPSLIANGGTAALSITLGNASSSPVTLTAPFIDILPGGMSITSNASTGTCTNVALTPAASPTQITVPTGTAIPAGGCTILVTVTSSTSGTVVNTTGILETNLTTYPTQSYPMELRVGNTTIWSANYYLTLIGAPGSYSLGPCLPTDQCIGSGLPPTVPFDTVQWPNFLERQGTALTVAGGQAAAGPPFGSVNPLIGVSLTPLANKKAAPVVYLTQSQPLPPESSTIVCPYTTPPWDICQ